MSDRPSASVWNCLIAQSRCQTDPQTVSGIALTLRPKPLFMLLDYNTNSIHINQHNLPNSQSRTLQFHLESPTNSPFFSNKPKQKLIAFFLLSRHISYHSTLKQVCPTCRLALRTKNHQKSHFLSLLTFVTFNIDFFILF